MVSARHLSFSVVLFASAFRVRGGHLIAFVHVQFAWCARGRFFGPLFSFCEIFLRSDFFRSKFQVIDGNPVVANYIEPGAGKIALDMPDESWLASHVRRSQYMLQIVRCNDRTCCTGNWRTNFNQIIPD